MDGWSETRSLCTLIKMVVGETLTLSVQKAFPLGVGPGADRHMCHRSQNGTGGGAGPKRLVSLAWGKKGLVGRGTHPKHQKFGRLIGHFEKVPGLSHTQTNIN